MVGDSKVGGRRERQDVSARYAPVAGYEGFRLLRRRYRRSALVAATVFLGWYFAYVGLSAFARGFMARTVAGDVNVALLLGLVQIVSTFAMAGAYLAYARRRLDPLAGELR